MSLRSEANNLLTALRSMVSHAEDYADKYKNNYIAGLAQSIRPLVENYERAINVSTSKEDAKAILSDMIEYVNELNGAATKGEMQIFPESDNSLNNYWRLHTIFRETQYHNEQL